MPLGSCGRGTRIPLGSYVLLGWWVALFISLSRIYLAINHADNTHQDEQDEDANEPVRHGECWIFIIY